MPAPPEESEPAMVSATAIVTALLAYIAGFYRPYPVLTRRLMGSKLTCHTACNFALVTRSATPSGDDSDGPIFRPVQMQARPVLYGGQRAGRGRDRVRDLLDRGRLRSAG